jgi:hypothetical protein
MGTSFIYGSRCNDLGGMPYQRLQKAAYACRAYPRKLEEKSSLSGAIECS